LKNLTKVQLNSCSV